MRTHGKLGDYSWIIDDKGWTTLYVGDPSEDYTLCDGFVIGDPEEAILSIIAKHYTRPLESRDE